MPASKLPIIRTLLALRTEIARVRQVADNAYSFYRLTMDLVLFRVLSISSFGMLNRERTIRLHRGVVITYRLNRGDIQSIREVWLEEIYRLPESPTFSTLIDLGANIGQATLYFAKQYGVRSVLAVEPNPQNAELTRRNLAANNIQGSVIDAAAGPVDGTAYFYDSVDSNAGQLSEHGRPVNTVSVQTLISGAGLTGVDLLKMDIEGGEQALLTQNNEWLARVRTLIAEFHPDRVDYAGLVQLVISNNFAQTTPPSFQADATEVFTRIQP